MKIILDACSAINLECGEVLSIVLDVPGYEFFIGPEVLSECGKDSQVYQMIESGKLVALPDDELLLSRLQALIEELDLGIGETECIMFADLDAKLHICSDDRKARRVASQRLGADRVIGSLALLKRCVAMASLTKEQALQSVNLMKSKGAFLPELADDFFDG